MTLSHKYTCLNIIKHKDQQNTPVFNKTSLLILKKISHRNLNNQLSNFNKIYITTNITPQEGH